MNEIDIIDYIGNIRKMYMVNLNLDECKFNKLKNSPKRGDIIDSLPKDKRDMYMRLEAIDGLICSIHDDLVIFPY